MAEVFFECTRNGRAWPYLVFGLVFVTVGLTVLVPGTIATLLDHKKTLPSIELWLAFVVVAPILWFGFVLLPLWMIWGYIRNPTWRFRIDETGITTWWLHYPWSMVRWIDIRQADPTGEVYFAVGLRWRPDIGFPSYPPRALR
jgi:hypothetical protein